MGSCGYSVSIKDRDVVVAASPVQEHWLPMSNLDLLLPPVDVGVFFCYKQKNDGMAHDEMTSVLKKALAQVLVAFYPFAGEMVENNQGEPELLCDNSGVDFLDAYADVQLKDLDLYHPDDSIEGKLVPVKKRGVLSVQVTQLSCGGLIVGCTFDHRVADAYSANMFFVAWAEAARLKRMISHIPSFRRSILNPNHPPTYNALYDDLFIPVSSVPPPPPCLDDHLQSRIYYILAKDIEHLQSQCNSNGSRRSKLCSFTAFLWKIIADGPGDTATIEADDDFKTCKMGVVVDGRERLNGKHKRVSACSTDNYFGNVLSIPYGEATYAELKTMPVQRIADMVHGFVKDAATREHFIGLIDWVELHRPEQTLARIYCAGKLKENDGEAVVVSSGQRFPVEIMDFGWGRPEFGSYHFPWGGQTGYVMPMPSVGKRGDWVVYMHLLGKHLDLIEAKASHIFKPLTPSNYLNL